MVKQQQMVVIECENCSHVGLVPGRAIDAGATLKCSACGWLRAFRHHIRVLRRSKPASATGAAREDQDVRGQSRVDGPEEPRSHDFAQTGTMTDALLTIRSQASGISQSHSLKIAVASAGSGAASMRQRDDGTERGHRAASGLARARRAAGGREGRQCMMAAIHCPRCHHRGAVALNRLPGRLRCSACGVTSLFRNGRAVQCKKKAKLDGGVSAPDHADEAQPVESA